MGKRLTRAGTFRFVRSQLNVGIILRKRGGEGKDMSQERYVKELGTTAMKKQTLKRRKGGQGRHTTRKRT